VENFPMDDIRVCMDDIRVYACTVASREIHLDYLPLDLVSRCTSGAGSTPGLRSLGLRLTTHRAGRRLTRKIGAPCPIADMPSLISRGCRAVCTDQRIRRFPCIEA